MVPIVGGVLSALREQPAGAGSAPNRERTMHHFGSDAELRAFRAQAMDAVSAQSMMAEGQRAWRDLTDGRTSILDHFTTHECSYLITTRVVHAPVPHRGLRMLERVLTGSCPKEVAADFDVSLSTIAGVLKQTLERLGSNCHPSKVPLGLVALMYSARSAGPHPKVFTTTLHFVGLECEVHMTPLPSLSHLLPPAVEDVVRLHAAGKTHREIAGLRGRSARTVANQLATAFQRIGSSGRLSMLEFLLSQGEGVRQWGETG